MIAREQISTPPRVAIIHHVLESAREAGVTEYVAMCRRLISADLRGRRMHADRNDWKAVLEAYDELRDSEFADRSMKSIG